MELVARVPKDLKPLLAAFRENRRREIEELKRALAARDLATLEQLGERMYALGNPYGFRQITTFGRQIREACAAGDWHAIAGVVTQYEAYQRSVTITFVPAAVERVQWREEKSPASNEPRRNKAA